MPQNPSARRRQKARRTKQLAQWRARQDLARGGSGADGTTKTPSTKKQPATKTQSAAKNAPGTSSKG
ncbi:MAG: hypothetical protein AAF715_20495 [Myxococcota bacterium]